MCRNDCDEIRPKLRNDLLTDSKMCQLEQIKDQQKRAQMIKDLDSVWHEVQSRDHHQGTEREKQLAHCRWHYNQSIQDFQKHQVADKVERGLKVFEEIDEERKQFAQFCKEDYVKEQERIRDENEVRKSLDSAVSHQIRQNCQIRKDKLERELKTDQAINEQIRRELERSQNDEKNEKERFRRDVFIYLDDLMATRHHNRIVEIEKEKLIDDIQVKSAEDSWKQRCDTYQKRVLVNQQARIGQFQQIKRNEKLMIEEAAQEKKDNLIFNERERLERVKIKELEWQQRVKAFRYGRELIEQKKSEELRDAAKKQELNERIMLADQERERKETMGLEFVKSYQDLLPLHPNLVVIQRGKHN